MDPSAAFAKCSAEGTCNANAKHVYDKESSCTPCSDDTSAPSAPNHASTQTHNERNHHGWRRIVLNFTPSWFAVTMGTGITSILLHNLPYNGPWLYWLSVLVFCLNILLFLSFLTISVLRYTLFRGLFTFMLNHPVQSLFTGTFPMGLATIVNMVVFVCVPAWGHRATALAWTLWWIDVVLAVSTCFYLPFVIMHRHRESQISSMTAAWLLPVVATIVAAASGGIVAEALPNPQHQLWTLLVSYVLFGTGFPLAMVILVMYFQRLTMHSLPPREVVVSVFLPLGPLGQGAFALMQLGRVAGEVFPKTGTLGGGDAVAAMAAGKFFYNFGVALALPIWGYGLLWLFFALATIVRSKFKFPFNMGWWGFTFPLGVYAVATTTLAKELPSRFFRVLGTVLSVVVVLLWLIISVLTVRDAVRGRIFVAPCVEAYEKEREGEKEKVATA